MCLQQFLPAKLSNSAERLRAFSLRLLHHSA